MGAGTSLLGGGPPESLSRVSARDAEVIKKVLGRKCDASLLQIIPDAGAQQQTDALFDAIDTDDSGNLSLEELVAVLSKYGTASQVQLTDPRKRVGTPIALMMLVMM